MLLRSSKSSFNSKKPTSTRHLPRPARGVSQQSPRRPLRPLLRPQPLPKKPRSLRLRFLIFLFYLSLIALLGAKLGWWQSISDRRNAATITIIVKDKDQSTILEDAKLTVDASKNYLSNKNGEMILNLVAGDHQLNFSKKGYKILSKTLTLKKGDNPRQTFSLAKLPPPLYSVKGTVKDLFGVNVANANIALGTLTATTDDQGNYSFSKIPAGTQQLTISKDGYKPATTSINIIDKAPDAQNSTLIPDGQIIYTSKDSGGKRHIYISGVDGKNPTILVAAVADSEDFNPVLSPDRKTLLFNSTRDGQKDPSGNALSELYMIGLDGQGFQKVSELLATSLKPIWSPDSTRFYLNGASGPDLATQKYLVYKLGQAMPYDLGENTLSLVFAPDSNELTYLTPSPTSGAGAGGGNILKYINLNTGLRKQIVQRADVISQISFSPDGQTIFYLATVAGTLQKFSDNVAGGPEQTIVASGQDQRTYYPSPDGGLKIFIDNRSGATDLYEVDSNAQNEKKLTNLGVITGNSYLPLWDPSGRYISFSLHRDSEDGIYIISKDGGEPKKVADFVP